MQQFQKFWRDQLSQYDSQLLVDIDTFFTVFCKQVERETSIKLTELQKEFLKNQIDPKNQNQVYKNGYLLFIKNFWGDSTNRAKFLNMKLNLSKLREKKQDLPMAGNIKIQISYPEQISSKIIKQQYTIVNDTIKSQSFPEAISLQYKGFVTIGSSPELSNIVIPHSSVNQKHIKIIYTTNLSQPQQISHSFLMEPVPRLSAYIRDVSNSSRLKYVLQNQNKYFVLKKNMILVNLGLVDGLFEMQIQEAPEATPSNVKMVINSLNAGRQSVYEGEPDAPLKIVTNYDVESITEGMVIDMYDRNIFYPDESKSAIISKEKDSQKNKVPLRIKVINKRTLQNFTQTFTNQKIVTIGRDSQKCNLVIDHISVRPIEITLRCLNQIWFVCGPTEPVKNQKICTLPGVYLSKDRKRNSNRVFLNQQYSDYFTIRNQITVKITVTPNSKQDYI